MKEELSSMDLYFLMQELQCLKDAKIDKIHMPLPTELLFIFHKTGCGKLFLRVLPGKMLYLTKVKFRNPAEPPGFCTYLRKHLDQARLASVIQKGFERIVELDFDTKEGPRKVIFELFSKGNVIVADEHEVILSALEVQEWKERTIRKGEVYKYPVKRFSFFSLTKQELGTLLRDTAQDAVVKALATDLGIGGVYAEELCLIAQLRKTIRPLDVTPNDIEHLYQGIEELRSRNLRPQIVMKLGKPFAVTPFAFRLYADLDAVPVDSFTHALDEVYTKHLLEKSAEKQQAHSNKELIRTQKIVEAQELQLTKLRAAAEENQHKGELIYHNYALVKSLLDAVNSARKTKSWDELKKFYAGHDVIKSIDEKNGMVTVELGFG